MAPFKKIQMEENTNTTPETLNVGAVEAPKVEETVVTPEAPVEETKQEAPVETVEVIHEDAEGNVIPPPSAE